MTITSLLKPCLTSACCFLFLYLSFTSHAFSSDSVYFQLPNVSLSPNDLGLIVNTNDPLSIKIANYYQQKRKIPSQNRIEIAISSNNTNIHVDDFLTLKKEIDRRTLPRIQAYAITWAAPYRVDCMSITSAIAMGYDVTFCRRPSCRKDQTQSYFNSLSQQPFNDFGLRPTMAIAATTFHAAKSLIDRGIKADYHFPNKTAYLLNTSDKHRNVRAIQYPKILETLNPWLTIKQINQDAIEHKKDVLFYFTGTVHVPFLESLTFIPGAMADHLTSTGGKLTNSRQMSSLRWLEAGATGSYGTVVEPCNFPQKFPIPLIAMSHYLRGETLIEAYWKSVMWPREGIFIGDPLATPYAGYQMQIQGDRIELKTHALDSGRYRILSSESILGPFRPENQVIVAKEGQSTFSIAHLGARVYAFRLVR